MRTAAEARRLCRSRRARRCPGSPRSRSEAFRGGFPVRARAIVRLAAAAAAGTVAAQTAEPVTTAAPLTEMKVVEQVTRAVDRALEYMAGKQEPDGGWCRNNAPNGLALLAFMGRGHVPGRGPYREVLERGKRFILGEARETGFLGFASMYEHGLATLALAEMYGMDPDPALEEILRKAVDLIVACQSPQGGWRYQPAPNDQDLSVSVMQIVALRAANNALIPVPAGTIEKAVGYVRSCAHQSGGYGYQAGRSPSPQTLAAGILSLQLLGRYDDPTLPSALERLATMPVEWSSAREVNYFYYFHYYAIQAQYQAGGRQWNDWHPRIRELLLEKQNADGSWDQTPGSQENAARVGPNKIYWTSMASLVLEIYMHFLPAYQR